MFDELNKNINYDECLGFNDEKQIQLTEWRNGAVLAAIATDKQALSFALKICFVPFYVTIQSVYDASLCIDGTPLDLCLQMISDIRAVHFADQEPVVHNRERITFSKDFFPMFRLNSKLVVEIMAAGNLF